jgi:methylenetetrahydrofolate reductase (NADPH)
VTWYASNAKGDFVSSDTDPANLRGRGNGGTGSTNAVTWGVFPGKEIVTPTIIEEVSFKAWAEEAFGIWGEWGRVYTGEKGRESRRVIDEIMGDSWLVNVIHHGYVEKEGLWELLLN